MRVAIVRPRGPLMVRSESILGRSAWPLKTSTGSMDAYEFVAETLLATGHRVTLVGTTVAAPPAFRSRTVTDRVEPCDVVVALQTSWQNTWLTDQRAVDQTVGAFAWIATGAPVVFLTDDPSEYMTFPDPAAWRRMAGFASKRAAAAPIAELAERVPRPIVELTKTPHLDAWNQKMEEVSPPSLRRTAAGWRPTWWNASCVAVDARVRKLRTVGGRPLAYVGHPRSGRRCDRLRAVAHGVAMDVYGRWDAPVLVKTFGPNAAARGPVDVNDLESVYDYAAASLVTVDRHMAGLDWLASRVWEAPWRGCPVVVDRAVFGDAVLPGLEPYCAASPAETAELAARFADLVARASAADAQRAALGRYRWQPETCKEELVKVVNEAVRR